MAEPTNTPTPAAERIRTLQGDDAIFHAFDAYPWAKDQAFLSGLSAILGNPSNPSSSSPDDLAIHARIFYYAQRIGVTVDYARYQAWRAQNPQLPLPQILPEQQGPGETEAVSWQRAAPKMDLWVDKSAMQPVSGNEPNYPMGFGEMLRLLQEGKEVPGIRQIPNTIARDPRTKPVGTRPAPKKPWEKDTIKSETSPGQTLDADFPPLETEAEVST